MKNYKLEFLENQNSEMFGRIEELEMEVERLKLIALFKGATEYELDILDLKTMRIIFENLEIVNGRSLLTLNALISIKESEKEIKIMLKHCDKILSGLKS
jgi:hypothetical protein